MDIRPCPNCHRTGRLLTSSADGLLQHYGCDLCGEVWVLEMDESEKPAPDERTDTKTTREADSERGDR